MEILKAFGIFVGVLVGLAVVIPIYFLPTIVASHRRLARKRTIGWLNLFLGWTTVGWIVLLIIASLSEPASSGSAANPLPRPAGGRFTA